MKRFFYILFSAGLVLAASSCVKDNFPQGHYLTRIKKVDHIGAALGSDGKISYVGIELYGRTATLDELKEIWSAYGDNSYPSGSVDTDSESNNLIDGRFKSVDIISLDAFDFDHPSNTNLNELFSFRSFPSRTPEWISNHYRGKFRLDRQEMSGNLSELGVNHTQMFVVDAFNPLSPLPEILLIPQKQPAGPCRIRIIITDWSGMTYTTETVIE